MALTRKIRRKFWNIVKLFRQIRGTLDVLDDLLVLKANDQKISSAMLVDTVNDLLRIWEAEITIDSLQ